MALQGNLRDFSAAEILQLLGSQRKTGCLALERPGQRVAIYVLDGRIVATRSPGLTGDDPLVAFLRTAHRLSDEQYRGILTIQRESGRDLEDLLLNGRYLDAEELAGFVERQILDDLMRLPAWEDGTYRFDPHQRWTQPPLVRLSIEGVLVEIARRSDEQKRYGSTLADAQQVLGVRDLPDPRVDLSEEERELFGIVDGTRTVAEVVAAAPLSEYETCEALQRMVESGWIEVVGRREAHLAPGTPSPAAPARPAAVRWDREILVAAAVVLAVALCRLAAPAVAPPPGRAAGADVFSAAQVRDVRMALALCQREHAVFPAELAELADASWLSREQLRQASRILRYHRAPDGTGYRLDLLGGP